MSGIKRLIETIASCVEDETIASGLSLDKAIIKVLKDKNIISSEDEKDTINLWKQQVENFLY